MSKSKKSNVVSLKDLVSGNKGTEALVAAHAAKKAADAKASKPVPAKKTAAKGDKKAVDQVMKERDAWRDLYRACREAAD